MRQGERFERKGEMIGKQESSVRRQERGWGGREKVGRQGGGGREGELGGMEGIIGSMERGL